MLVDATIWEMTPPMADRPMLLAVVGGPRPVCLWTWTRERGTAARRARRLVTYLSGVRYGRMTAFEVGVEVTRLLEDGSDYALTCEPFMTHARLRPPTLTTAPEFDGVRWQTRRRRGGDGAGTRRT